MVLFAGPSPSTGTHLTSNIKELFGVTSFSYDISQERQDVPVFGKRAAIRDALDPASVSADFSYNIGNVDNEARVGFITNGVSGAFANILNNTQDERNYFVSIAGDGVDGVGANPLSTPCIAFGNATISNWSMNASVGQYPTSSISFTAIDVASYNDSDTEQIPAININTGLQASGTFTLPTSSGSISGRDAILRPRDVTVNISGISGLFYDTTAACVQSVDISVDFGRNDQLCLGGFYRKESVIADVIPVTLAVEFLAKDMITGRLSNFACQTGVGTATVSIKRPSCLGNGATAVNYELRGLYFESLGFSSDAGGDAASVTLNYQGNIGGANDLLNGLFISGISY